VGSLPFVSLPLQATMKANGMITNAFERLERCRARSRISLGFSTDRRERTSLTEHNVECTNHRPFDALAITIQRVRSSGSLRDAPPPIYVSRCGSRNAHTDPFTQVVQLEFGELHNLRTRRRRVTCSLVRNPVVETPAPGQSNLVDTRERFQRTRGPTP
jgi:hypothetical protein